MPTKRNRPRKQQEVWYDIFTRGQWFTLVALAILLALAVGTNPVLYQAFLQ